MKVIQHRLDIRWWLIELASHGHGRGRSMSQVSIRLPSKRAEKHEASDVRESQTRHAGLPGLTMLTDQGGKAILLMRESQDMVRYYNYRLAESYERLPVQLIGSWPCYQRRQHASRLAALVPSSSTRRQSQPAWSLQNPSHLHAQPIFEGENR
jgi:hypothetical protein